MAASVSMTALSFVQFLNPTSHWYCLFLLIAVICALGWLPREYPIAIRFGRLGHP